MRAAAERAGWLAAKAKALHLMNYITMRSRRLRAQILIYNQIARPAEGSRDKLGLI